MKKILDVKHLTLSFGNTTARREVVSDISFFLNKNEVLGIVGESGSGKSVTALSLLGLCRADYGKKSSVCLNGEELIGASDKVLQKIRGNNIGFIFQEPMSSLNPLHKIGQQVAESILLHQKINKQTAKEKTVELLKKVGLKDAESRYDAYPFELSGGQRQRVMIAMAIANAPEILIADEPTTALDVTIQKQIISLILELKKSLGMSVIFISHDLKLVSQIADRILVMHEGKIVEQGMTREIFDAPKKSYTKKLISSYSILENKRKIKSDVLLGVKNLSVRYPLKKNFLGKTIHWLDALFDVTFDVYKGQTLGIVGESGSGKTTIGLSVAKLIKYQGVIQFEDAFYSDNFWKDVQIIFQDPYNSLNPRMNVLDIIGEGLKIHKKILKINNIKDEVIKTLESVGLSETDLYKYPHEFSGGQRQRIAIARAIILKPKLIVLDEPTSALDVTIQKQIIELLKKLQKETGITYIFISHDMRAIKAIADRIAVMQNGRLIETGTANQILNAPQNLYTKSLISASVF